jgi:hypothetical protein
MIILPYWWIQETTVLGAKRSLGSKSGGYRWLSLVSYSGKLGLQTVKG